MKDIPSIFRKGERILKNFLYKAFKIVYVLVKLIIAIFSLPITIFNGIREIIAILKSEPKKVKQTKGKRYA